MTVVIHKFGGSSLSDSFKIKKVPYIVGTSNSAIIVSAIGNTTDMLRRAIKFRHDDKYFCNIIRKIQKRHEQLFLELKFSKNNIDKINLKNDIEKIKNILSNNINKELLNFILGFGELWSAQILTEYFLNNSIPVKFIDASKILIINDTKSPISLNWKKSNQNMIKVAKNYVGTNLIITGFIAQNQNGFRTILGMNSSDYSAAIFAKLLKAKSLIMWTDVAGIYRANPKIVKIAKPIKYLSYQSAFNLAYFGASIIHPLSINPMSKSNIPIYVKSSLFPERIGTKISHEVKLKRKIFLGVTNMTNVILVETESNDRSIFSLIKKYLCKYFKENNLPLSWFLISNSGTRSYFVVKEGADLKNIFQRKLRNLTRLRLKKKCSIVTIICDYNTSNQVKSFFTYNIRNILSKLDIHIYATFEPVKGSIVSLVIDKKYESNILTLINYEFNLLSTHAEEIFFIDVTNDQNHNKKEIKSLA